MPSFSRPEKCYFCGAIPEYNKQGYPKGNWEMVQSIGSWGTKWYDICPECYQKNNHLTNR